MNQQNSESHLDVATQFKSQPVFDYQFGQKTSESVWNNFKPTDQILRERMSEPKTKVFQELLKKIRTFFSRKKDTMPSSQRAAIQQAVKDVS